MKTIVELIVQLAGGVVLLFAAGWIFARATGYDEYDKILYDEDTDVASNTTNQDNEDDVIHRFYI
jgi:hypothetical protein